jgi:addiction module RelE/StbE family toxin
MSKYKIEITNRFKKDYKKIRNRNNFNEDDFKKIINMLANGENLPEKYCNHLLEPKKIKFWNAI